MHFRLLFTFQRHVHPIDKRLNLSIHSKVKVKVKVKFTLEQATKSQRGSTGIALLFP
jgi:hypothetical protein